jgi:hypothetical protein
MPKEYQKKPGYLGNANLKPIGVKIDFTKQQVEEYVKCANDPVYFGRNYVKVVTLDHGISNFDLYDYQEKLIRTLEKNRFVIGKLSRQAGKTTTVGCCYLLHKVLFNQNMNVCILANKLNTARDILARIRESYEHLPSWLQQGIVEWNKGSIVLENGSKIVAAATSSSAVRGGSYNCISGTSIITIKDNLTGEIYNISIEDFYSNSSRNTDYYKYFDDNDGKQIQEMVFFSDGESEKENRYITGVRKTPYNSTISGWDKYERQSCSINYKRTFIGTSPFTSFFDRDRKSKNVPCLLSNGEWETGQICENVSISYNGSENQLFRSEKNYASGIKTFRRNKEKNIQVKQRKNNFTGSSPENKQFEYWSFDRNQKTQGLWGKNFKDIDREKENKRTLGQNKQESRKNQKDSINTSRNETITRSKRKNAPSSFITDTKKWWSVEQRKETNRWEVLTADGFKSFRGISKTHNRATIKLVFDNNSELICTEDHKIATNDGFIEAKKLNKNHEVISSNNILHLVDIINDDDSHVYDLLEVTDTHSFFANNILVHNCIFLDEFAFVPTTVAEEFFSSVYPTITAGQSTQMIIISTPKGLNMYYQLWKAAISKQSEYVPFEVSWRDVPQYPGGPLRDDVWKEQQIKNTSERQFDAEYNCSFVGSANTLIDANKLNQLSYGKPRHKNGEGLVVYQEPIKGTDEKENQDHQYFITVDVARGQGKDNSAFVVFDITTMPYRIVARFKSNVVSPLLLPSYIRAVGKKYNNAYVLVEVNDIGSQVADILHNDLEYENLIKSNFKGTKGQTITEIGGGNRLLLGVRTTNPVKKLGCAILKNLIEQDKMVVDDSDTIDELTTFIADGVSFRADDGHTDDLVMCLVLFSWATRQDFFETLTNKDIRVEMFNDEIEKIEAEIVPFGFIEDGRGEIGEVSNNDVWFDRNDKNNKIATQFWIF